MGQIGKPHGLGGEVYVVRISDDPHRFEPGSVLMHEDGRTLKVAFSRTHRNRFLVGFDGCTSREQAESLRGALYVPAEAARTLGDDEYWPHQLIGCTAFTPEGSELGRVAGVVEGPAQDLLTIETPAGERYVPMVKEIVLNVDVDRRRLVIAAPPGLLE